MFSYKVFRDEDILLAISDKNLIGKRFEQGELVLEVLENFYSESDCDESRALELIKGATIVNAVGEKIISLMVKEKLIDSSKIIYIDGVPHAQIITIR